jgi:hypothetical protein
MYIWNEGWQELPLCAITELDSWQKQKAKKLPDVILWLFITYDLNKGNKVIIMVQIVIVFLCLVRKLASF